MNKIMKSLLMLAGIGSLALTAACGGGGNGGGFGSGGGGGNNGFSNSSLSGKYAYQLAGFDLAASTNATPLVPFREAGVFTADGNGHITSGTDDIAGGGTPSSTPFTGTYSVSSDGTAAMTLNFTGGGAATFALTVASSSKIYVIEADATGFVASGVALKQDPTAFSGAPSGTFAYRKHDIAFGLGGTTTSAGQVGAFTVTSGSITGNADSSRNLVVGSSTITGSFNFPDANSGRGTGTLVDSVSGNSTFVYYVVDASHLLLFSTNTGMVGIGQVEKQSGVFSAASLSGSYVFGSVGDAQSLPNDANMVGRFTADGSGGISGGSLDGVEDGVATGVSTPVTFTGSYTLAGTGRANVTFNATTGNIHQILWMVSPSRAFLLTDSATEVEDGTVDSQTGTFSTATLNSTSAFNITGFDGTSRIVSNDFVGTLKWGGNGNITSRAILNLGGVTGQPSTQSGTYTVTSNGRVVASVSGISNHLVFYMVSPTDAYILQNDANVELQGSMSQQH